MSFNSGLALFGCEEIVGKMSNKYLESVLKATRSLYGWNYGCLVNIFDICKIFSSCRNSRNFTSQ